LYKFEGSYFIEKGKDGLQQLTNETREVYVDGKKVLKNTNQYISTINMLVFECVEIRTKIQKARLEERSLTNLIEDYNRCKGESSVTFKAKRPWTKTIIGVTAGLNISQLNFNGHPAYDHLAGDFEGSRSPLIGFSFDILSPRLNERVSFHGDLLYLTSKYYSYTLYSSNSYVERNYVSIELQQLKVPVGFRYTFARREVTPYINAGISFTIHLGSNSKWVQEVASNRVVSTYENEALAIENRQFGLWGGCGVMKSINKKLNAFVELRYEQTDGIVQFSVDSQGLDSKIPNFQVLIGVRTK
jgi:hypothetical protein